MGRVMTKKRNQDHDSISFSLSLLLLLPSLSPVTTHVCYVKSSSSLP